MAKYAGKPKTGKTKYQKPNQKQQGKTKAKTGKPEVFSITWEVPIFAMSHD